MGDALQGDYKSPRPARQLRDIAKGLERYYPSIVQSLNAQVLPQAQAQQSANEVISPQEQALNARLYQQYAPVYSQAAAGADLAALQGAGGESVRAADALQKSIEPEYYSSRAAASEKLNALLGGMDPNKLTGAEEEGVSRGLARSNYQTGELNVPSRGGAVKAALTYGNALTSKRNAVANAISTAAQALPQFRSGVDVFGQATGRAGTSTFGSSNFNQPTQQTQPGNQVGQNALGLTGQLQQLRQQINANRRTVYDAVNQSYTAAGSGTSGFASVGGCYILREIYGKLPESFERILPQLLKGLEEKYLKLASKVVPLMRINPEFKEWVKINFAEPILKGGI